MHGARAKVEYDESPLEQANARAACKRVGSSLLQKAHGDSLVGFARVRLVDVETLGQILHVEGSLAQHLCVLLADLDFVSFEAVQVFDGHGWIYLLKRERGCSFCGFESLFGRDLQVDKSEF